MRKLHLIIILTSFITVLISLGYGITIQNAGDNFLTAHLNSDDGFNYSLPEEIPTLSFKAAMITLFFLVPGLILQLYIFKKTNFKQIKKLSIGAFLCFGIILLFDFLTLLAPHDYNFKHFGMIWVLLSLSTIFINGVSIFARK